MKSLDEYRKEIEKDPKARRNLRKLEKEFKSVEESLTEEELIKYGLRQGQHEVPDKDASSSKAESVLDVLSHRK